MYDLGPYILPRNTKNDLHSSVANQWFPSSSPPHFQAKPRGGPQAVCIL